VTNCHLAFTMLASGVVAFSVALVFAGIVAEKKTKREPKKTKKSR
tara:strand:- start:1036 stop:1170 length:135 start_codon:yes stop_codon:yes gene_type:complete